MQLTQGTAEELDNAKVALVLVAIVIAVFWRTVLRLVLAVIAAVVVVLLGLGAFALIQAMHF